ncbi:uncharacterized protein [Pyrus communis]
MNQAKAMKATIKSSTEKKQPIESTTPNNVVSVERFEFNGEICIWIRLCSGKSCQVKQTIEPFKKFGFPPPRCGHSSYRNCRLCWTDVVAIEAGTDIALANKETLIAGGPIVLPLAPKHN